MSFVQGNGAAQVATALTQPLPQHPNCCLESAALFKKQMSHVDTLKGPTVAMLRYLLMCVAEQGMIYQMLGELGRIERSRELAAFVLEHSNVWVRKSPLASGWPMPCRFFVGLIVSLHAMHRAISMLKREGSSLAPMLHIRRTNCPAVCGMELLSNLIRRVDYVQ